MDVMEIKKEIKDLKERGRTSYENCEKLICLEQALMFLEKGDIHDKRREARFMGEAVCHELTWREAEEWTSKMKNSDGSCGPHWSMEKVQQVIDQYGITCDPVQFYAVLNAVYSDYYIVAKKHGLNNKADFYIDIAKAWLEDDDAVEDKAKEYFNHIVKH